MSTEPSVPSGLTVDGIAVPQPIEAEGAWAVEQYVAEQRAIASITSHTSATTAPAVESAPNPPTFDEGAE